MLRPVAVVGADEGVAGFTLVAERARAACPKDRDFALILGPSLLTAGTKRGARRVEVAPAIVEVNIGLAAGSIFSAVFADSTPTSSARATGSSSTACRWEP